MLAAEGHGVTPAQIAKTLSLRVGERNFVVVTRGDARLDNKKAKAAFGGKARMLNPEEVLAVTGHPVGGVSPFGLASALPVYCDVSLKAFDRASPVARTAMVKKPNPQATPMAPASHMLAPVVRPEICARDWMMVPAARNATPAVTASMARMGSAECPSLLHDRQRSPGW